MVSAVGAVLSYLIDTEKSDLSYIKELTVYAGGQYLDMDINTRRNLELTETMRSKEKKGTLLWVLDKTHTAMGGRMLRSWLEKPLLDEAAILHRQDAVEELRQYLKRSVRMCMIKEKIDLQQAVPFLEHQIQLKLQKSLKANL